jgi:Cu-Zn family superoxide dismutase
MILPRLLALLAVSTALAGCADLTTAGPASSPSPSNAVDADLWTFDPSMPPSDPLAATFLPWTDDPQPAAVTYDPAVVPPGATVRLTVRQVARGTQVALTVTGLVPRRSYGAHLHTAICTAVPAQAGPHYQHDPDPMAGPSAPSVDPSYANPRNEVWLDFTADATGAGAASVTEDWAFDEAHPPRSLVLHSETTRTGPGDAGMAGPRVACLTLEPS